MRWLFLLLVVLNGFYYLWHQQQAPLRVKDVTPLALYKGGQQEIRLVRESAANVPLKKRDECLVVGGVSTTDQLGSLRQRLLSLDITAATVQGGLPGAEGFWLKIAPESERLLDQAVLASLSKDFKDLKHKIILCEGVATAD